MSESTAVAETASAVPARRYDSSREITREDVALPRIKKGEFMSDHVKEGRVAYGAIFAELGNDDPAPVTLAEAGNPSTKPVTMYVLDGPRKAWSLSDKALTGGELKTWAFDDPERPEEAWVTYQYAVAIPDHDQDLPYTILFTRTSAPAAKQLNLLLMKASQSGDPAETPIALTAKKVSKGSNDYTILQVALADVKASDKAKHLEVVNNLRALAEAGNEVKANTSGPVGDGRPEGAPPVG